MTGDGSTDLFDVAPLAIAPARRAARRLALVIAAALVVAFAVTAPFAAVPLRAVPSLIPAYDAAVIVIDIVIAILLWSHLRAAGEPSLLALACAFIFTPPIVLAHALTFPDAFVPGALIGDAQSTAWLWMAWHGGFPLFVLVYAWHSRHGAAPPRVASPATLSLAIAATLLLALGLIALALSADRLLPVLMLGHVYVSPATRLVLLSAWLVHLGAMLLLAWATRLRRAIDLWAGVMMLASLIDLALSGLLVTGRFQVGFYAGRACGLFAALVVLALLLGEVFATRRRIDREIAARLESEAHYRTFASVVPALLWHTDGEGGDAVLNRHALDYTGLTQDQLPRWGWLQAVHPADREAAAAAFARAFATGRPLELELRLRRADGAWRWFLIRHVPIRRPDGTVARWYGAALEIDDRRRAEERQATLLAELQHRVRNILAMIRSVMARSADGRDSVADYAAHLESRLQALARTQVLLARAPEEGVDLNELLLDEMQAQAAPADRYTIDGPAVRLSPRAAEVLTLALHELATNALKYGALACDGRIAVGWRTEDRDGTPWLLLDWHETGVAPAPEPRRRGFGTELIERRVPYELKGRGEIRFGADHLRAVLAFPLAPGASVLEGTARFAS